MIWYISDWFDFARIVSILLLALQEYRKYSPELTTIVMCFTWKQKAIQIVLTVVYGVYSVIGFFVSAYLTKQWWYEPIEKPKRLLQFKYIWVGESKYTKWCIYIYIYLSIYNVLCIVYLTHIILRLGMTVIENKIEGEEGQSSYFDDQFEIPLFLVIFAIVFLLLWTYFVGWDINLGRVGP